MTPAEELRAQMWAAAEVIMDVGFASVSTVQRRLHVGYARAALLVDELHKVGVVGPARGTLAREVLVTAEELAALRDGTAEVTA